jgi:hypothetical protein
MDWRKITNTKIFDFIKAKRTHRIFPYFWFISTQVIGMLYSPTIAALGIFTSAYLLLIMFVPEKSKHKIALQFALLIICFFAGLLFWDKLIAILPSADPYRQPLRTGEAHIEVVVEPNGVIGGGLKRFGGAGISLLKELEEPSLLLMINGLAEGKPMENGQVLFRVELKLDTAKDKSINKPICNLLAETKYVVIWFEKLPPKSRVRGGQVIFTFNSFVRVWIPIPPQTMESDAIIIQDVQEFFQRRN